MRTNIIAESDRETSHLSAFTRMFHLFYKETQAARDDSAGFGGGGSDDDVMIW